VSREGDPRDPRPVEKIRVIRVSYKKIRVIGVTYKRIRVIRVSHKKIRVIRVLTRSGGERSALACP
jgi:hypothetical protein